MWANRTNILSPLAITILCFFNTSISLSVEAPKLKLTGFLRSYSTVQIGPLPGREWRYKIISLSPEGTKVKKGNIIAKVEGENLVEWEQKGQNELLLKKTETQNKIQGLINEITEIKEKIKEEEKELSLLEVNVNSRKAAGQEILWIKSAKEIQTEDMDLEIAHLKLKQNIQKLSLKEKVLRAAENSSKTVIKLHEDYLESIQKENNNGTILAPVDGVLTYLRLWDRQKPQTGVAIFGNSKFMSIVDEKRLFIEAYLKEPDFNKIRAGDLVDINILGSRQTTVQGKVKEISPMVMKVSDFEKNLSKDHPLFDVRAFRVTIELAGQYDEAKPEGEVEVLKASAEVKHD